MPYREGDQIEGVIYRGEEAFIQLKAASVKSNDDHSTFGAQAFEFDAWVQGKMDLKVNDKCRLVTDDGELEVQVIRGVPIPGAFIYTFIFTQAYE
jgi:hypothetical protein